MSTYRETGPVSTLVAALSGNVFGLDPSTGRVLWEHELDMAGNPTALVVTESFIYAATFKTLACLRYPTGKLVWSVDTREVGRATLMLDGERLIVAKRGVIECFSLAGETVWHNGFKGKGQGAIALGYPGIVVQADDRG